MIYECTRCGVCCFMGPCMVEGSDENGALGCSQLKLHPDGTTSCRLLAIGKVKPNEIGITGCGCIVKRVPEWYEKYLNEMNSIKRKEYNVKC